MDAVRCAIEIQNGLIERNAGVPEDRQIEFRVGIHVGDVVEESDGDLMGDGVDIAARLEGIAAPGAIYPPVRGRLSAGEWQARDGGHRSRPDPAQEHRQVNSRLFAAGRDPGKAETGESGRTRDAPAAGSAHAAEVAVRAFAARRRHRGTSWLCPLRAARGGSSMRTGRQASPRKRPPRPARLSIVVHALRQPLGRSGAGLPRRRPDRRTDHQSVARILRRLSSSRATRP